MLGTEQVVHKCYPYSNPGSPLWVPFFRYLCGGTIQSPLPSDPLSKICSKGYIFFPLISSFLADPIKISSPFCYRFNRETRRK